MPSHISSSHTISSPILPPVSAPHHPATSTPYPVSFPPPRSSPRLHSPPPYPPSPPLSLPLPSPILPIQPNTPPQPPSNPLTQPNLLIPASTKPTTNPPASSCQVCDARRSRFPDAVPPFLWSGFTVWKRTGGVPVGLWGGRSRCSRSKYNE